MPELPEVEAIVQTLRPLVRGKTIVRCEVLHPIAVRRQRPDAVEHALAGARIEGVQRRGKYLLLPLGPARGVLVMHFRLDGQLVWFDQQQVRGHVDVALEFEDATLGFVDRRHFGRLHWFRHRDDSASLRRLGVDPLSPPFTPLHLEEILRKSRRPVKLLLMDQARIAGLGNIYSSEALWHARINPRRRAHRLSRAESRRLHKAIVGVLRRALECCRRPPPDFRNRDWWFVGLDAILRVYDREGKPCKRCGTRIGRFAQGGRSTYCCPRCQR